MELIIIVLIVVGALVLGLVVGANNKRRIDEARKKIEEDAVARAKMTKKQYDDWKSRQG